MEQVGPKNMIFTQKGQKTGKKTGKHDQRPKNRKNRKNMTCMDTAFCPLLFFNIMPSFVKIL